VTSTPSPHSGRKKTHMPTYCDKCEAVLDRDEERTHINGEDLGLDCADPSSTTIGLFKTIDQHRGQLRAWVQIDGQYDQLVGIKSVAINGNTVQMEIDMADVAAFGEDPVGPTFDQMREAVRGNLREDITVDDYLGGAYSPRPGFGPCDDFDQDRRHEIVGRLSSTGNPIVCEIEGGIQ